MKPTCAVEWGVAKHRCLLPRGHASEHQCDATHDPECEAFSWFRLKDDDG